MHFVQNYRIRFIRASPSSDLLRKLGIFSYIETVGVIDNTENTLRFIG